MNYFTRRRCFYSPREERRMMKKAEKQANQKNMAILRKSSTTKSLSSSFLRLSQQQQQQYNLDSQQDDFRGLEQHSEIAQIQICALQTRIVQAVLREQQQGNNASAESIAQICSDLSRESREQAHQRGIYYAQKNNTPSTRESV
mmetsp:Transcript_11471/g.26600  ORF Transcript_11471/g.26600 Transcript_11471/m.26600 type:complete len:144 (-) Transcript_11471:592-1023(-)